jgi:uridine phosphorylase
MYKQGIEVKRNTDVGILIEKSSWFPVIETIFPNTKRIYYPNDQDEVLHVTIGKIDVAFISGQGSSMAACMTERLRVYGAKAIVRVGTCGALSKKIRLWDPIITMACFSSEGTSSHYLPKGYPILSDFDLNTVLMKKLNDNGINYQQGVTVTTDGRWREDPRLLKELSQIGAISIEMETSAIFSVCQFRKLPVAAINIPADLPADEDNNNDFKGIPDRKAYKLNLENSLTKLLPSVVNALVDYYQKIK